MQLSIEITQNRVKFWNPGKLPLGITLEDLFKLHKSVLRNNGFIEQWGTGIRRIIDSCLKQGFKNRNRNSINYGLFLTAACENNCHFGLNFLLYITYLRFVMNLPYNKIATLMSILGSSKLQGKNFFNYGKEYILNALT
ncbi:MAG: ATP-binding protein [Methanosarcinales archaeon]